MNLHQCRILIRGFGFWLFATLATVTGIDTANRNRGYPHEPAPIPKITSCLTIGVCILLVAVPLYREGGKP